MLLQLLSNLQRVSPDGKWLLFGQNELNEPCIMAMKHFSLALCCDDVPQLPCVRGTNHLRGNSPDNDDSQSAQNSRQTEYAEAVVRLPFPSLTIAAVLMALLVSQAASSVCAVQCVQRPAMAHCHAMSHAGPVVVKSCSAGGICKVDLLVSKQRENTASAGFQVDYRSDFVLLASPRAFFSRVPRTSVSPPPLLTSLRI